MDIKSPKVFLVLRGFLVTILVYSSVHDD